MKKTHFLLSGLVILLVLAANPVEAQSPAQKSVSASEVTPPLRIATRLAKPDAFETNGQLVGFSVDLGHSILEQLKRESVVKPYADIPQLLKAMQARQADLGMAAIAITSEREAAFDFSHPILFSGLQILVPAPAEQATEIEQILLRRLLEPNLLRLVGFFLLLMLILVHLLWFVERRDRDGVVENFNYFPGIFQALWWVLYALVGHADGIPKGPMAKTIGFFWSLVGIIFLAYFTAVVTAELTLQEFRGDIQDFSDLPNRPVALVAEDSALNQLKELNIQQVKQFAEPERAYQALLNHEVDAIVAPRPLLLYYAANEGQGRVQVVGTPIQEQFYSIVMPKNSPYRRPVNQAIVTLKKNGIYGQIYRKWFGINPRE